MIKEEWEESVRQMKMLFSIVLMPFFGKWMGRRWSYWGESRSGDRVITLLLGPSAHSCVSLLFAAYERYLRIGLGRQFLGLAAK
jgi:hypothetical protein